MGSQQKQRLNEIYFNNLTIEASKFIDTHSFQGSECIDKSHWRVSLMPSRSRYRIINMWVRTASTIEDAGAPPEEVKKAADEAAYGVSPLIMLAAEMLLKLLWYWWTHRNKS